MSTLVGFVAGLGIGAAGSAIFLRKKYEDRANHDIQDVKKYYYEKYNTLQNTLKELSSDAETDIFDSDDTNISEEEKNDYEKEIIKYNYSNYCKKDRKEDDVDIMNRYVIPPEEFDSKSGEGYECCSLTYYADGVLADEWDNPIEDIDDRVGEESLTHFGEYEDDSVFVRNDDIKVDFEILLDDRNYNDLHSTQS